MKFKRIIEGNDNLKDLISNAVPNKWIEVKHESYKSFKINKDSDGYSWSIKKNNNKFIYPTSKNEYEVKYWKKESTAKQNLINFLKL